MALTLTKLQVTPLPGALVRNVRLGEAASAGMGMTVNSSSQYVKADGDTPGKRRVFGVMIVDNQGSLNTSGDYASGDDASMCFFGPLAGFSGMTPGAPVYVDKTTAGLLTQTAPSGTDAVPCEVGYALTADILFVFPRVPSGGYDYT